MVTAGVFMVSRMSPLFEQSETALAVVTIIGAATAFFAATVGCVQNDIKRVIAYSTCSQLGYMFFAIGVSAYPAAIFHLFTHAFFKALLFLGAGSVIHAMSDEQDIRKMGGIAKHVKVTCALMWIGSLALAGIPPFAGHYSKDAILSAAWASGSTTGHIAFFLGIAAAFMTAFYSWRLLILVFHGKPRADDHVMGHVHESPLVMIIPLLVLSVGAVLSGAVGHDMFVGEENHEFWRHAIGILPEHTALASIEHVPDWVEHGPLVIAISGIALAYLLYVVFPGVPGFLAKTFSGLYQFLLNKWYFDELFDFLFVRPAFKIGRGFWQGGDGALIDGVGPDGVAAAAKDIGKRVAAMQSGYLYHYAFAMLIGIVAIISWYAFMAH
jgi:NADH-quinone oxidoreductase subunit L